MYPRHFKAETAPTSNCGVDPETQQQFIRTGAYSSSTARSRTPTHRDPGYQQPAQDSKRGQSITRGSSRSRENHKQGYHRSTLVVMLFGLAAILLYLVTLASGNKGLYNNDKDEPYAQQSDLCPDYKIYAARPHPPYTSGTYALPFQRPKPECRLFQSQAVEDVIQVMIGKIENPDLARLFENAYPNTLDTTVRWFTNNSVEDAQSFIVTGDINAQWLRDSTNQLSQYQHLAKEDPKLRALILGAINTQASYVLTSPYCNAFQPPPMSGLPLTNNGQDDTVHPIYDPTLVFECKYEIDSLANFLSLANQYYSNTGDSSFVTPRFVRAVETVLVVVEHQQVGSFGENGEVQDQIYTFQRRTNIGTETLNLGGVGNPLASFTSLVRSAFRPSDDATILQYFIPGNAMLSVELKRIWKVLKASGHEDLAKTCKGKGNDIEAAIKKYGIVDHPEFGKVYAYEVDGYGSHIIMDDANLPSLLSLPLLGFLPVTDPIYQNTRRMILSQHGNPYFLRGKSFRGIGGPHIGIRNAWPMSLLVQIMTTDNDEEIKQLLEMLLKVSRLGLVHESVNVNSPSQYTRSWFAWANAVYAQTIFDLEQRKPHLIFKSDINSEPA